MTVRVLEPSDAAAFQALRLRGLREDPTAFASSYEEESGRPISEVAKRLAPGADGCIVGVFEGADLIGAVGVHRERHTKLAHKAILWGVYVAPEARRRGHGLRLVQAALAEARERLGVRQVNLGVNTKNEAAIKLYESMGFRTFGVERGYMMVDGQPHDEAHMVWFSTGAHMPDNLDTVRSAYAGLARGDVPAVLGILAPSVQWIEADGFPYAGTYTGPQAVLEGVFMRLGTEWEGFSAVPHEFVVQEDTVVALGEYRGTYKASGKSFQAPFAHVWKLRDGKAVSFRQYTDTALVRHALT